MSAVVLRFTFDGTEHTVTMDNASYGGPDQAARWTEFFDFVWRVLDAVIQTGRSLDAKIAAPPAAPAYLLPGDGKQAIDDEGSVITVAADGGVWRDGARLGAAFVAKLAIYGSSIYGKGKTDGLDWQWSGGAWITAGLTLDHAVIVW